MDTKRSSKLWTQVWNLGTDEGKKRLDSEFNDSVSSTSIYLYTRVLADEIRYCIWEGQDPDGRKHADNLNKQPFPWEGAADTRVRFVDDCCTEEVDFCMGAINRALCQCVPVDSSNQHAASIHTQILDWQIRHQMGEEWEREWELALQWRASYGTALMSVTWLQETDIEEVPITVQDIFALAQADENVRAVLQDLQTKQSQNQEPSEEDIEIMSTLMENYFPGIKGKKAVKELLKDGQTTWEREYLKENRPAIRALRHLEDIFMPPNTYTVQHASWIARRDILTVAEVRDRAELEGWDEDFTEDICKNLSRSVLASTYYNTWRTRIIQNVYIDEIKERCEVFYVYTKEIDESGKRRMYENVYHPSIKKLGKREVFAYDHGKFPVVELPRERISRALIESRGIPEMMESSQMEIKAQRDSRVDRTSIATLPPLFVPQVRGRQQIPFGPGVQIAVNNTGSYSWMNPPPMDQTTLEVEAKLVMDGKSFLGQFAEGSDTNKLVMRQQRMINRTLAGVREVCKQIHQLDQQYMTDDEVQKIIQSQGESMHAGRDDIQGDFIVSVEFDAKDLNLELLKQKWEIISTMVAPMDKAGIIDWNYLIQNAAQAIDPTFARQGIKDVGSVTQKEVDDEKNNVVQMLNGIEPAMPTTGVNYQLRMQVLMDQVQNNPMVKQALAQNKDVQGLFQNRAKYLGFQIQQQANAQIGRVGTQQMQPSV